MQAQVETPLRNIGLAFSGGGFRAAAFALGTMSYLSQVSWQGRSLLERCSFISSTSGGSITNAFYTQRLYQGQQSAAIFKELYAILASDTLLETALRRLTSPRSWKIYPHKTHNLINAFAITYDQLLFQGQTLGLYWNKAHSPHVEEVCFNSTELNNGISFRFHTNGTDGGIVAFGNYYLGFQKEAAEALKTLRIADVVAASSCFPVGFEPLVFPQDFVAGDQSCDSLLEAFEFDHHDDLGKESVQAQAFGLIDGGVVDNQGLYSLGLEDQSRPKKPGQAGERLEGAEKQRNRPFDLMIACDVASYFMGAYKVPQPSRAWLLQIPLKWILASLLLILPLTLATVVLFALRHEPWYYYLLLSPAYLSSGLIGLGAWKAWRVLRRQRHSVTGKMLHRHLGRMLNLPLSKFMEMIQARGRSFSQLALDVYLKQIRRLHLSKAYQAPQASLRLISNFIYELAQVHRNRRMIEAAKPENAWWPQYQSRLEPSEAVEATAEQARRAGTTLWFDPQNPSEIDHIAATGQFTTCYNLIRYLNRLELAQGGLSSELEEMRRALLEDWARFQEDPKWMLASLRA